jgi:hypothetical protein
MSEIEPQGSPSSGDASLPGRETPDQPTTVWAPPQEAQISEPAPVAPDARPKARASRVRWALALVLSVVVVAVAAGVTLLVTGQSAPSGLVGYVDKSSVIYAEARLDLPGDQRQKLGEFLSKFPGFDDQSILDRKLDEALDRIISEGSHGQQDWSTKIKPWFDGQVVVGVGIQNAPSPDQPGEFHGVFAIGVRNGQAAVALSWLKSTLTDRTVVTQPYDGTDLLLVSGGEKKGAAAIADGKALLIGDVASVKQAIDSHGNGTFAQSDGYKQARAAFTGDNLGFAVVDTQHYMDVFASMSRPAGMPLPTIAPALKALLPPWIAVSLRAEADAVALDVALPHRATMDVGDNRSSDVISHLPATAIVAIEGHDLAANWKKVLDAYRQTPSLQEPVKQLDTALAMLGGFDAVLGWMRDGAIVVTRDGSTIDCGVVISPTDAAAAQRLLTSLRSLVVLGGAQAGIKISDESYNGTTISTVDFGNLADLAGLLGGPGQLAPTMPIEGHAQLAYVATDSLVVFGANSNFVKSVLDTKPDTSLASQTQFKSATDRAGSSNRGLTYVDLMTARELIENVIPDAAAKAEYENEYKPYLSALKAFVVANREDGSLDRGTEWLIVGN